VKYCGCRGGDDDDTSVHSLLRSSYIRFEPILKSCFIIKLQLVQWVIPRSKCCIKIRIPMTFVRCWSVIITTAVMAPRAAAFMAPRAAAFSSHLIRYLCARKREALLLCHVTERAPWRHALSQNVSRALSCASTQMFSWDTMKIGLHVVLPLDGRCDRKKQTSYVQNSCIRNKWVFFKPCPV
jgi:hypothetical protein